MNKTSARFSLAFSCVGHTYSHLFAPIFYVVALALEGEWGLSHGEVVALVLWGNVLFGVAAPAAGLLGDRWSSVGMMTVYFLGTGLGMVATGLADGPVAISIGLAATGLFAAIYHPVGIAWLVRNAENRGAALGINGVFGGIAPAVAAMTTGVLIDVVSWRAAFMVPGAIVLLTGIAFLVLVRRGTIVNSTIDAKPNPPTTAQERARAFVVLSVTMLCTGLIYQATQPALPKAFSMQVIQGDGGVLGVSTLVAIVYVVAGGMQVVAGRMADRYPLKLVYLATFVMQIPLLLLAGALSGGALVVVAMIMVTINVGTLPAENSLVARYAPSKWRGLAFGLKFILAFGLSGLGVKLEGAIYDLTGGFHWLFTILAAIAAVATAAGLLLPSERPKRVVVPAE